MTITLPPFERISGEKQPDPGGNPGETQKLMTINEILAKVAESDGFTDEEKNFAHDFSLTKIVNDASASARRKAEKELGESRAEIERLTAQIKDLNESADSAKGAQNTEIAKLTKMVENLNSAVAEQKRKTEAAEAARAKIVRDNAINAYAKAHGITPIKGIAETGFNDFFRSAVGDTDIEDADAMTKVVEKFKSDYAGMIAAGGTSVPHSGAPVSTSAYVGVNPFRKETENLTAQFDILQQNPELAKQLATEAGVSL